MQSTQTNLFKTTRKPINALTGLRFIPACAMVYAHSNGHFACVRVPGVDDALFTPAVTFFFILSGFVLTYNYPNLSGFKESLHFYALRISRIWPAHVATLLLLVLIVPQVFKLTWASSPTFFANLFMLHSWIPCWKTFFSFNGPSWTNSTEFFFYLSFPLLLVLARKHWALPVAAATSLAVACVVACNLLNLPEYHATAPSIQGLLYINPLSRVLEFSVGMVIALLFASRITSSKLPFVVATLIEISILASVVVIGAFGPTLTYNFTPALTKAGAFWLFTNLIPMVACALLIVVLAQERGLLAKVLRSKPFVWLGEISFGVYMLHAVLLAYGGFNFPQADSIWSFIGYFAALILSAHLLSLLIEQPARKAIYRLVKGKKPASTTNANVVQNKPLWGLGDRLPQLSIIGAEIAALIAVIYFSMPTIEPITAEVAKERNESACGGNLIINDKLRLDSASIRTNSGNANLQLVWQAKDAQHVDGFVTAVATDRNGNHLGTTTFAVAPRREKVAPSAYFATEVPLSASDSTKISNLSLKFGRSWREQERSPELQINKIGNRFSAVKDSI